MFSQMRQDSSEEDVDAHAADRMQRFTCEATASEPERSWQAEVTRANDHPHQAAATEHATSSRRAARSFPTGGQLGGRRA